MQSKGPAARTYRIMNHDDDWATGVTNDGRQVFIIPVAEKRLAVAFFDADGNLLSVDERETAGTDAAREAEVTEPVWASGIRNDLGLRLAPICVRQFEAPTQGLAIRERPESFDEFLAEPDKTEPDPKYRERTREKISEWARNGRFILCTWGKEYWMDGDGSVYAT